MVRLCVLLAVMSVGLAACKKDHGWEKVTDDDPRLEAARQQAKDTFPEFVKAFGARKPMHLYTVEVKVEEGGNSEYLTLDVRKLTDQEVTGVIIGYPRVVKHQSGETITAPVANISDWRVETPEGEVSGGYVEQERAKLQRGNSGG
jgi:uncharacterized protein YegJ (DUF2314 family)